MAWVFSIFFGLIIGIFLGIFENRWRGFLIGGLGIFDVFLGIFDGLGFKSAPWVSDRWLSFADQWLGWWVWWPLLAPTGLMVYVCVALLKV